MGKEITESGCDTRNRHSHSLGSLTASGRLHRSVSNTNTATDIRRCRSKGHISDTGVRSVSYSRASQQRNRSAAAQRRRQRQTPTNSDLAYVLRAKLNPSGIPLTKSSLSKSRRLHRTVVDGRLASLSLNSDSRLMLSSASDSNVDSCPTGSSGHTTPSESTSLSSAGCVHGENHMGSGPDHEIEKTSDCIHYAPSGGAHASHTPKIRRHPVVWNSACSSSSSSSSFVSSSLPSTRNRSPPLIANDKVTRGISPTVFSSDAHGLSSSMAVDSSATSRRSKFVLSVCFVFPFKFDPSMRMLKKCGHYSSRCG